jgi:hypothetical protein
VKKTAGSSKTIRANKRKAKEGEASPPARSGDRLSRHEMIDQKLS